MRTIECKLGSITIGKFEIYPDKSGQYCYRLKANNGEIIAISEGYSSEASCMTTVQKHIVKVTDKALVKMRRSICENT